MGIFDSIREWGQSQQEQYESSRMNEPAELPDKYKSLVKQLPADTQLDVERYLQIFNNDITPVLNFIDELTTEG